ncbi:cytochrome b5 [Bactrocera neohumeralis]|uniref:cytochrome b5 n=1 Tax=Bactrocera tryoni TaxID=59916 RepID=UPI001A990040|nr:cytochrome b5 [Bactrocera tryoni]XP_050336242.1 cytochrome b5 [Bactrocera neohumeralis]
MSQEYSVSEVAQNNGRDGKPVWIIYKESVYDVTTFINEHPGGAESILEYAGKDATKAFNQVGHSSDAIKEMKSYKIGVIRKEGMQILSTQPTSADIGLNEKQKQPQENCSGSEKKRIKFFFCF